MGTRQVKGVCTRQVKGCEAGLRQVKGVRGRYKAGKRDAKHVRGVQGRYKAGKRGARQVQGR